MSAAVQSDFDQKTGALFGSLWGPYNQKLFEESVRLFTRRLDVIGFDPRFFEGKICLDAGCGGGRNTIAMARLGATEAHGIDIGAEGIEDARRRAASLPNASFQQASVEAIPYPDDHFDVVWCAGVLMHVGNDDRALDELVRVLKPGGMLYMLVYATGGMRWPLIQLLKPLAAEIGQNAMEAAVERSGIASNKRRTFIDDLYCPKFDFFHWSRLEGMLRHRGLGEITRWGPEARLDHEHSLRDYREDLEVLVQLLAGGTSSENGGKATLFRQAHAMARAVVDTIAWFEEEVASGRMTDTAAMELVIGQGHHRLFAVKGR
jgi:ubiquinone/menaquinone biosynthesis C-methylase UbiE